MSRDKNMVQFSFLTDEADEEEEKGNVANVAVRSFQSHAIYRGLSFKSHGGLEGCLRRAVTERSMRINSSGTTSFGSAVGQDGEGFGKKALGLSFTGFGTHGGTGSDSPLLDEVDRANRGDEGQWEGKRGGVVPISGDNSYRPSPLRQLSFRTHGGLEGCLRRAVTDRCLRLRKNGNLSFASEFVAAADTGDENTGPGNTGAGNTGADDTGTAIAPHYQKWNSEEQRRSSELSESSTTSRQKQKHQQQPNDLFRQLSFKEHGGLAGCVLEAAKLRAERASSVEGSISPGETQSSWLQEEFVRLQTNPIVEEYGPELLRDCPDLANSLDDDDDNDGD